MPHPALPAVAILAGMAFALLASNSSPARDAASSPPPSKTTLDKESDSAVTIVAGNELGRELEEAARGKRREAAGEE